MTTRPRLTFHLPLPGFALAVLGVLTMLATAPALAQTFTVIHTFTGPDGANPYAGLTIDQAGRLYGTTWRGGAGPCTISFLNGCGTVFRLTPHGQGWLFSPLYSFQGADGEAPFSRVIFGPDGTLYGTTSEGGAVGQGTVFNLKPPAAVCKASLCPWDETVLHSFTGTTDGGSPYSEVLLDQAGNLYGTTYAGGDHTRGTVFELTRSNGSWEETVLSDLPDGKGPYGGLIFDASGNLYGTTSAGGYTGCDYGSYSGCGTVFQLTPSGSGWTTNTLYDFQSTSSGNTPLANMIMDGAGNLYGTTLDGGQYGGGTAFELTNSNGNWSFHVFYAFFPEEQDGGADGPLLMDSAGNLYVTVLTSGYFGYGQVLKLIPSDGGWAEYTLHTFTNGDDGRYPSGSLVMDSQGNLYGTASTGGAQGYGLVWEITP
jgi:uncharacterized repeat protein (TIGR03803 family)